MCEATITVISALVGLFTFEFHSKFFYFLQNLDEWTYLI